MVDNQYRKRKLRTAVGFFVGDSVGFCVGDSVGFCVGELVGLCVGLCRKIRTTDEFR